MAVSIEVILGEDELLLWMGDDCGVVRVGAADLLGGVVVTRLGVGLLIVMTGC